MYKKGLFQKNSKWKYPPLWYYNFLGWWNFLFWKHRFLDFDPCLKKGTSFLALKQKELWNLKVKIGIVNQSGSLKIQYLMHRSWFCSNLQFTIFEEEEKVTKYYVTIWMVRVGWNSNSDNATFFISFLKSSLKWTCWWIHYQTLSYMKKMMKT